MDDDTVARHAERIVEAIARRSEQDPGMTLDQVQQLLIRRVRDEAEALGIRPRMLMGAVWRAWERRERPPLLGPTETRRVLERLAERGLLVLKERPGGEPAVLWCGLSGEQLRERLAAMDPPLDHEERLFLEGIRRHLEARAQGAWFSWDVTRGSTP
ncbi:MAG TPA: hypothetical protein VFC93_06520 [Chloroflexota bacterium]|nr:hypothetical protein [Chloroflexota bacterium]